MLNSLFKTLSQSTWFAWIWTILILAACTWPGKDIPSGPPIMGFDKIVHAGLFGVWIVLWLLALPEKTRFLIMLGMAYGLGLEVYQQLLPFDRTFDWWDAAADAVGVFLGYLFKSKVIDRYLQRLY